MRGLLDTSIFVAREAGRPLAEGHVPEDVAISVVTLAELELGVQLAPDESVRARRMQTLSAARETYAALPIVEEVASAFAEIVASMRRAGRRGLGVQDAWIAATAKAHGVPIVTQDADFDGLPGLEVVRV